MNFLEKTAIHILHQTRMDYQRPFNLDVARLFVVSPFNEISLLTQSKDIYALIESIPCMHRSIGENPLIALETCGWAAPVGFNDVCPPSEHPQRIRTRLVLISNRQGDTATACAFQQPTNRILSGSPGDGLLCDALGDALRRLEMVKSLRLDNYNNDEQCM